MYKKFQFTLPSVHVLVLFCPEFVVSRVCHVQNLSCPGFVCPGFVCPGFVCPGFVCPGFVGVSWKSRDTVPLKIMPLLKKLNDGCLISLKTLVRNRNARQILSLLFRYRTVRQRLSPISLITNVGLSAPGPRICFFETLFVSVSL
jgi:hypothetical protein